MLLISPFHISLVLSSFSITQQPRSRMTNRRLLYRILLLLLGLTFSQSCLAADNGFEPLSTWVRPLSDAVVRVKLPDKIDAGKKLFLRMSTDNTVADLLIDADQAKRRFANVRITVPLRRGDYETKLVNEDGAVIASSPKKIHIAATEKPVITSIMPKVVYPKNDRYDFEIIGDNFNYVKPEKSEHTENSNKIETLIIRINDVKLEGLTRCKNDVTGNIANQQDQPCLIESWRSIRIHDLKLNEEMIVRPLEISVEIDKMASDPKPLTLSKVQRKMPRIIAIVTLIAVAALVYIIFIRKITPSCLEERNYPPLAYLFIDPQTNTYSLSKLQMVIWAAAAIVAYSYLAASQFLVQWKLGIPSVPEGLPMLLGISATTTAMAVGATEFRGSKGAGLVKPGIADFITTGGVFAPERLQFFVWTVLGALTFVAATLSQDPGSVTEMASIPDTFNQLMGASSLGYLAGKFARKPGPVIKSVAPDAPSGGFKIKGENLSPRAKVMINEEQVTPVSDQKGDDEFVTDLIVHPGKQGSEIGSITQLKIKNPDGQLAEWSNTTPPAESDCGNVEEK